MNDTPISNRHRRTFFVGLNTGYVKDLVPDDRMIDFYGQRSSPLLDCAIVGNVVIPGGHGTNSTTPRISRDKVWAALAAAIASRGTMPGIQLATAWEGFVGGTSFHPKDWTETIARSRGIVGSINHSQVERLFESVDEATEIAAEAGFRHVQLHAAHGYLFSLLIDGRLYEGAEDCLQRVSLWARRSQEMGLETSMRISLRTGDPAFDSYGAIAFQDAVSRLPVDLIDVSSGFYNIDKRMIYPSVVGVREDRWRETARLAKRHPRSQFILSGRAYEAVAMFPANVHLGLCRDILANAKFLKDSHGCQNSGKCHYHSRGAASISCPRWESSDHP